MEKKYLYKLLFLIILLPSLCFSQTKTDWSYPLLPGSQEWREAPYNEKVEKSQIPDSILYNLNTEDLLGFCIQYPLNKVMLMFNQPDDGFDRVFSQSKAWQEFIKREDALDCFIKRYTLYSFEQISKMENVDMRNEEYFVVIFLEKLLVQTDFTESLNLSDKKRLLSLLLSIHESKKEYPDIFLGFSYNSSISPMIKIIGNSSTINLKKFKSETGGEAFIEPTIEEKILNNAQKFLEL